MDNMANNFIPQEKPSQQKLYDEALQYKNDGNELYKIKHITKAIRKYHYALLQLKDIGQDKSAMLGSLFMGEGEGQSKELDPDLKRMIDSLNCDCYNNLAACLLKQPEPNYTKVISYCDNVIDIQSNNSKAHYRRGVGLFHLNKYDEALEAFNTSLAHAHKPDPLTTKYISLCKEQTKSQDAQLKQTYKNMMSAMSSTTITEGKS